MKETRVDADLLCYHQMLLAKPQVEEADIQCLLDAYREKFDVDLVFAAERRTENDMVELTQTSCKEQFQGRINKKYYGDAAVDESYLQFDEDGLCTYGYPPFDRKGGHSILHYGIFYKEKYIGSVGILNFTEKREWDSEVRLAVQQLGRVLQSSMYLNRVAKMNADDQDTIDQQGLALDAFFSTTDCGLIRQNVAGDRILSVNQSALQLLDYNSREEMNGEFDTIARSVMEEDQYRLKTAIRKLRKAGDRANVGYRVKHRNGKVLDIISRIRLVEENGKLVCQRVLMDCTEQRLHDKKILQEKEAHWNEVVAALSADYSSAFYLDVDTGAGKPWRTTENVKKAFHEILEKNLLHADIQKEYVQKYVHPEDRERVFDATSLEMMKKELQQKRFYHITYRIMEGGVERYFRAKFVRVGNWEKERGVMVGFRDVTDEVRAELEKKQMMEDALKKAEAASEAKTSFLNNMSHDIRTPMNAIIGYTTLAEQHFGQSDRVWDYLQKISTSSKHLLSLINDILDMSRIESGKFTLENTNCSLKQVMEDLNTVMSGQIQDKQLCFRIDMEQIQDDYVSCDKLRLNQVLINIVGNAVKFTPKGGEIAVLLRQKEECFKEGCAAYQFRIKDTGIGMSEEFVGHLFEQFSRERNTTISGIPGTGLGMSITKRIVDMMDGTIAVQSRPGEGTEFIVDLEFAVCEMADEESQADVKEQAGRVLPESRKLLLVEDNPLNQEIASEILSDYGFEIDIANNGKEAVETVKNAQPDEYYAVLMDVQMPVMNGYEAAKEIRMLENKEQSCIPIIAMTANAFDEDRKNAFAAGMNGFVTKPIDVKQLIGVLDALGEDCA
jgi:signal transduction histidine kinase/CheY-like chemotaxis protein/PAS domain-containing protein